MLSHYLRKLTKLKVDRSKGAPAPHKPILLLSIIQLIENKTVTENKIHITPELVAQFRQLWSVLVTNPKFSPNFALPFYHLQSDGFWHLHTHPGREVLLTASHSIRSFRQLKEAVAYASFDDTLFSLLLHEESRLLIRHHLLQVWFPSAQHQPLPAAGYIIDRLTDQVLSNDAAAYKAAIAGEDEEERFVRAGIFKKVVPNIYNYTCCITGMRIIPTHNIQMIDACHIMPFSRSHDDTITNGISLCPNLHRAFDRGLVTISTNYKVIVSESFSEAPGRFSIRRFHGAAILLPKEAAYFPKPENLLWHRHHIFQP